MENRGHVLAEWQRIMGISNQDIVNMILSGAVVSTPTVSTPVVTPPTPKRKSKMGGNPPEDGKDARHRYLHVVVPEFAKYGYISESPEAPLLTNWILYDAVKKTAINIRSSPSDTNEGWKIRQKYEYVRNNYPGYAFYVLYTRDTEEWSDKPTYNTQLKLMQKDSSIKGILFGMDQFHQFRTQIECGERIIGNFP